MPVDLSDYRVAELLRRQQAKHGHEAPGGPTPTPGEEPDTMSLATHHHSTPPQPATRTVSKPRPGVHFDAGLGCFVARIRRDNKLVTLGRFDTRDLAEAEYQAARAEAYAFRTDNRKAHDATAASKATELPAGVRLDPKTGLYIARCSFPGQKRHLGSFKTAEEASAAYQAAKARAVGRPADPAAKARGKPGRKPGRKAKEDNGPAKS